MDVSYLMSLVVVLGALVVIAAVVLVIVLVSRSAGRSSAPSPSPGASLEDRLAEVDRLHEAGRVTDTERAEARARLLGTL